MNATETMIARLEELLADETNFVDGEWLEDDDYSRERLEILYLYLIVRAGRGREPEQNPYIALRAETR